jgi:hypothetical protein
LIVNVAAPDAEEVAGVDAGAVVVPAPFDELPHPAAMSSPAARTSNQTMSLLLTVWMIVRIRVGGLSFCRRDLS